MQRLEAGTELGSESSGWGRDEHTGPTVVRRNHSDARSRSVVPVKPHGFETVKVPVDHSCGVPRRPLDPRTREPRDAGTESVGANDQVGQHGGPLLVVGLEDDPAHTARPVAHEIDDARPVHDLRAGSPRGPDEDRIEHGAARCVERIDTVLRLDRHRNRLVAVVERRVTDGGRARGLDLVEQAPPAQLEHSAAHQRVRRERVAPRRVPVDREHGETCAGQEHCGRGSRAAGAHDDRVVASVHAALEQSAERRQRM